MNFLKSIVYVVAFAVSALLSANVYANNVLMAKAPDITLNDVEILRWVERDLYINLFLTVDNKNPQDIPIKSLRYDIQVMGQTVAKDYRDLKVVIKANSLTEIIMPVTLDMVQLFSVMPEAILTNQLSYTVIGAVAVEGLVLHVPFEKRGDLVLVGQR